MMVRLHLKRPYSQRIKMQQKIEELLLGQKYWQILCHEYEE